MTNRPSTYAEDVTHVTEWGLQQVPQAAYAEGIKHHLMLRAADVCKSTKPLQSWKDVKCHQAFWCHTIPS